MNTNENKLNRSRSESDIYNISFGNTYQHKHPAEIYGSPAIRRTVVIEEIFGNCDQKRYLSCTPLVGEHFDIGHLQNSFNHIAIDTIGIGNMQSSNKKYLQTSSLQCLDSSSGVVPMDVDSSFDCDERYPKLMGTDFETTFSRPYNKSRMSDARYKALDNVIKTRTSTPSYNRVADQLRDPIEFESDDGGPGPNEPTNHIPIEKESSYKWAFLFLTIAVVVMFVSNNYGINLISNDIQIENVQKDLSENVFEQSSSVDVIVHSLENRKNWPDKVKVLGFVGSQGVGKTFIANIIKKHFVSHLVHDIFGLHLSYESQRKKVLDAINTCCLNLVVIDDLTRKDNVELFAFVHSLPRNNYILVISIFNIQYTNNDLESEIRHDDFIEIQNAFNHSGLHHELVLFQEFTSKQVEMWVEKQLSIQNVSTHIQDMVMKSVLRDHNNTKQGLKGLHSKILLELKRYNK